MLILDGCPSRLNIDLLKELGGYGMVVLLCMMNTSHETNVEDLVTFGIANTEFQNAKQPLMTEHHVLGNTDGLKREDLPCLLKQSLEKACTTVLNWSGWVKSGVYHFEHDIFWRVRKVYIKASAAVLAAAEPLTLPTKLSDLLTELNANAVNALTTALTNEPARKLIHVEANFAAQA